MQAGDKSRASLPAAARLPLSFRLENRVAAREHASVIAIAEQGSARGGSGGGGERHADDGAVSRSQGEASGFPALLPHGRFLRAVLRRRGEGFGGARHCADEARQARGRGHPHVRRAGRALGRIFAEADPQGLPRGGGRAARRPGGRQAPRAEGGGAPRCGAAGDARHAHRGCAAGFGREQLPHRRRQGRQGSALRYYLASLDISTGEFLLAEAAPPISKASCFACARRKFSLQKTSLAMRP